MNYKIDNLKNKVVVVAGGAKNLGGLISRNFGQEGANVVVHYNSSSTKAEALETVNFINSNGGKAFAIQLDLTVISNMKVLFDEAVSKFGKVDIAVNTVGKIVKKDINSITEKEYDSLFDVNSKVGFFFIQEAAKHMNKGGKIINILTSLLAGFTGYYSLYAGAKAPVEHFTRAAAKEFAPMGISVNSIAPGPMDTPFFYEQETPETVEYLKAASFNNELTKIEDIAPIVKFLSTEGWFINGQTILANGGFTTR